jgi:type I restriction-modification system DNA methylase subunit
MVLIKHGDRLTIAIINRRYNKLDQSKDVLGKVTLIRDINITQPHRGHVDILTSLALPNLKHPQKKAISDFDTLHAAWEQILNVELLNQRFYRDLSNWYFWALKQVEFPADLEVEEEKRKATGLIRLLTRLIFCWFLKEKDLVPDTLFNQSDLSKLLKEFDPESEQSSTYYQAILQNLFFATLNQRMGKDGNGKPYRGFAADEGFLKNRQTYDINNLYRYEELFSVPQEEILKAFEDIPFLNGGLFECLDRADESTAKKTYIDGFSRNPKKRPHVPNRLFFDSGETADLSGAYGDTKRKAERVEGLVNILQRYKFTIVENTPIDQEIALDPELLGKVFENLLASYNEETKTTARKQTGSFYTPRPIVDYMVDEALKAHLQRHLVQSALIDEAEIKSGLDLIFAYTDQEYRLPPKATTALIKAIDELKILDPACGSGAFPMGMLHKLVHLLSKLDRHNVEWEKLQISKVQEIPDIDERRKKLAEIASNFTDNNDDYGRKLYLIENCLYGVDIQPIAIQITKLRFFISLVCDQKTNRNKKENHGIRPLPNLETKFVSANSLIGLPVITESLLIDPRVSEIESQIDVLYHTHFSVQRRDQKLALQRKINAARQELAKLLSDSLITPAKARHIAAWEPFDSQISADFFDPHWMFGRSVATGFDIVIGNPPYFKENDDKRRFEGLRELGCYQGKMDVWYLFVEIGLKFLKENGHLSFIATNNWVSNAGASKLRNLVMTESTLIRMMDFQDYMVFESASIQTMIMLLRKGPPAPRYQTEILKANGQFGKADIESINDPSNKAPGNMLCFAVEICSAELKDRPLLFNPETESPLLNLLESNGPIRLLDSEIAQGIAPNPDCVNSRKIKTIGETLAAKRGIKVGDGVFVLTEVESHLISSSERNYLKPLYEPTHISKYSKKPTDLKIIYSKKGVINPQDCPSILAHLHKYREIMEARRENLTGQLQYYHLHWPRDESFFKAGPKILVPRKCATPTFYYTEDEAYVMLSMNVIRSSRYDLRFLSAVLNSSVVKYWLKRRGSMQGMNFQIDSGPLQRIPIPNAPNDIQCLISRLVSIIQTVEACNKSDLKKHTQLLQDLIDGCVTECYLQDLMAENKINFSKLARAVLDGLKNCDDKTLLEWLSELLPQIDAGRHPIRKAINSLHSIPLLTALFNEEPVSKFSNETSN